MPHILIDRLAAALAHPATRRRAVGMIAAAALTSRSSAGRAADGEATCPPCAPGETCIQGTCAIVVTDGCEAFGCADGLACIDGICREPEREPDPTPCPDPDPAPITNDAPRQRSRRRRKRRKARTAAV